jgi:hypothetical protein
MVVDKPGIAPAKQQQDTLEIPLATGCRAAVYLETRYKELDAMLFGPRMARLALGVMGVMGVMGGQAFQLLAFGSAAGLFLGILATPVLAFMVDQATPRDPLVLAGVVLCCSSHGVAGSAVHMDSRATRAVSRSYDIAARGVNCRSTFGRVSSALKGGSLIPEARRAGGRRLGGRGGGRRIVRRRGPR